MLTNPRDWDPFAQNHTDTKKRGVSTCLHANRQDCTYKQLFDQTFSPCHPKKISLFQISWCEHVHAVAYTSKLYWDRPACTCVRPTVTRLLVLVLTSASSPGMPGPVHSGHPYHFRKLRFPNSQNIVSKMMLMRRYRHGRFHLLQKGIICHIHDIGPMVAIVGHWVWEWLGGVVDSTRAC